MPDLDKSCEVKVEAHCDVIWSVHVIAIIPVSNLQSPAIYKHTDTHTQVSHLYYAVINVVRGFGFYNDDFNLIKCTVFLFVELVVVLIQTLTFGASYVWRESCFSLFWKARR